MEETAQTRHSASAPNQIQRLAKRVARRARPLGGSVSLELVLLVPALMLLVLFVLWAGRGGRAGLVSDLAAGEAAVVASVCCEADPGPQFQEEREQVVEEMLSARPGLDFLCIGGARPRGLDTTGGFVDEAWLERFEPEVPGAARGVGALGVRLECETDGAVAPLRGLFPTVRFYGQAAEVMVVPPRPRVTVGAGQALEGDLDNNNMPVTDVEIVFRLRIDQPVAQDIQVEYWTAATTAPGVTPASASGPHRDYVPVPQTTPPTTVTIPAGATEATVEVDIVEDNVYEHDEVFELKTRFVASTLPTTNPPTLDGADPITNIATADATIENDDAEPVLSVNSPTADEGRQVTFTATLNNPTAVDVTFNAETRDATASEIPTGHGKAEAPADYTALTTAPHTINADEATAPSLDLHVQTIDDTIGEPDEVFLLAITNITATAPANTAAAATATIKDNEPKITIDTQSVAADEGNPIDFKIVIDQSPAAAVTVDYTITDGTATQGDDYAIQLPHTAYTGTITFTAGTTTLTETITINTIADNLYEARDETFELNLSNQSTNATITTATATGTIKDGDPQPALSVADAEAQEGQPLEFVVTLTGDTTQTVTGNFTVTDVTTTAGDDYTTPTGADTQYTIAPPDKTTTISVETTSDNNIEVDETFTLEVTSASYADLAHANSDPQATGTIKDASKRLLRAENAEAFEGDDLEFVVNIVEGDTRKTSAEIRVDYVISGHGTTPATALTDYTIEPPHSATGTLVFAIGEHTKTITLNALTDLEPEGDELVRIDLTLDPTDLTVGLDKQFGVGTIKNVDPPLVTVGNATAGEGDPLTFTVSVDKTRSVDTQVQVYTYSGTAAEGLTGCTVGGSADYAAIPETPLPRSLTIAAGTGVGTATVDVVTCSDFQFESSETMQLRLKAPQGALLGTPNIGIGTITDVVQATVSVEDAGTVVEGDAAAFVVRLNSQFNHDVTVYYTTNDLTAFGYPGCTGDYQETRGDITFAPNITEQIVSVQTCLDNTPGEPDEEFKLVLTSASGADVDDGEGVAVISDRQAILRVADAEATEGEDVVFEVTAEGQSGHMVTAQYTTARMTTASRPATGGANGCTNCDYITKQGEVAITIGADGTGAAQITVETKSDNEIEPPGEYFKLNLSQPQGAVLERASATGFIVDPCVDIFDPTADEPTITGVDQSVTEGAGSINVEFTVAPPVCWDPGNAPVVAYRVIRPGDTALVSQDFTGASGGVFVHRDKITINWTILDDPFDEVDETFTTYILAWDTDNPGWVYNNNYVIDDANGMPPVATAVVTIEDDDPKSVVNVQAASTTEGGTMRFQVTLDQPTFKTVTVPYTTVPRSAGNGRATEGADASTPGADYIIKSGSVTFTPSRYTTVRQRYVAGTTVAFIEVDTLSDSITSEGDETFLVSLRTPLDANFTPGAMLAEGTIIDGDLPTLSISSPYEASGTKVLEGNSARFTVSLSDTSLNPTDVRYQLVGGTATPGVDFRTRNLLTGIDYRFRYSNSSFLSYRAETLEDLIIEGDESFFGRISNASSNAVIVDEIAEQVIRGQCADPFVANQEPPVVEVANVEYSEDAEYLTFVFVQDRPFCSGGRARMTVRYIYGSATYYDLRSRPSNFVLRANTFETGLRIFLHDDDLPEGDETFQIEVSFSEIRQDGGSWTPLPASYASVPPITAFGTILDNDNPLLVSVGDASGPEGGLISFPVELSRLFSQPVEVDYSTRQISDPGVSPATSGADFTAVLNRRLTIDAGNIGGVIRVPALLDADYNEVDEVFQVVLSSPSQHATLGDSTATGTILDVSPPQLSVSDAVAEEGQILRFEVTLDRPGEQPVSVGYSTANGTAQAGSDYLASSGVLRFAPGETNKTVEVATLTDSADSEGTESFLLNLATPSGAGIHDRTGQGRITNLAAPAIRVSDLRVGEAEPAVFQVTLSNRASRDVTVDYATASHATSGSIAATPRSDYTPVSGTVTVPAGGIAATVAVSTADDLLDEYNEEFRLVLSNPDYGSIGDGDAAGLIIDDDPLPNLSIGDALASEGDNAIRATITLDQPSGRSVTVDYRLSDGTATAGDDYVDSQGTVTIPPGATAAVLAVGLVDDDVDEDAEVLTVTLSNPRNASIADGVAQLSIGDDDGLPTIHLVADTGGSVEGAPAQITIQLVPPSSQVVRVDYRTSNGTATAPGDYTAVTATTHTFQPGDTEITVSTPTADDSVEEDTETIMWVLSGQANADLAETSGTSWIIDNDGDSSVSVADARVTEGGGQLRFTVRLTSPSADAVTVTYRAEADPFAGSAAAVPGQDFTSVSGEVSIAAGQLAASVAVPVADDAIDEGTETLWLRLGTATGADITDAVATGTIVDDDPEPRLSVHDAAAIEGSPVRFAVRLSEPSGRAVRVQYAPHPKRDAANQARPLDDYIAGNRFLLLPAGTTEATALIGTIADRLDEYSEEFQVQLFNPTHAIIADSIATGTILDANDLPRASVADTDVFEDQGPAEFTVTLSHPSTSPITIAYNTLAGTATAGDDFTASSGTVAFSANIIEQTFTVPVLDDSTSEGDEAFSVQLRNPSGANILDSTATATILDDDGLPRFSIADSARAGEASGSLTLTVTLSHASTTTTTVHYDTFDNRAVQPGDYTAASGTLTFAPGTTTQTITVPIIDDLLDEDDETITVRLSNPTAATVHSARSAATGTIEDDDPEPSLRLLDATAIEGDPLNFTAVLNAPSGRTVSVDYTTLDNTASIAQPGDYTAASGTLTFPPGTTTQTITVATLNDARIERNETLLLALNNPRNTTLGTTQATGTIQNRTFPAITIDDAAALEGDPIVFTIKLDRPANTDITIDPTVTTIEAYWALNSFYNVFDFLWNLRQPALVVIPAGQTQATLSVPTVADAITEGDERFLVTLVITDGDAQILDASAVGTILENALAPSVSVNDTSVPEGGVAVFSVTLDRHSLTTSAAATVSYTTKPLTATPGTDYTATSGTLTFPAGTGAQTLTISVNTRSDTLHEVAETLQLELHSPQGAALGDPIGIATILDDDSSPTLSVNTVEADEGTPMVFTATLDAPTGLEVTASYRTSGATATEGVDYTAAAGSLTFPVGTTSQQITVTTLPDSLVEPDETLALTLSDPVGAGIGASGAGTIIDATRPAIRISGATAHEGSPLTFTVTMNRQTTTPTAVSYTTADGTATAGADYTATANGTATFPAGTTTQTITVPTLADSLNEPDETITVTLTNPSTGTRILTATGTGTIKDNPRPTITVADAEATERSGTISFTARLSHPSNQRIDVSYQTGDDTATSGINGRDYSPATGRFTFLPGSTTYNVDITVSADYIDEGTETFYLDFSNPTANAVLTPSPYRVTGTIHDSDPLPTIVHNTARTFENNPGTLVISLHNQSGRDVTVDYAFLEDNNSHFDSAEDGLDFTAGSGTVTIPAGDLYASIPSPVIDDLIYEPTEVFAIRLSNPTNARISSASGGHFGRWQHLIYDNEPSVGRLIPVSVVEGDYAEITLTMNGFSNVRRTLPYLLTSGTATAIDDFEGPVSGSLAGNLVFHRYARTATLRVLAKTDAVSEGSEWFGVQLRPPPNIGVLGPTDTIIVTILDNTSRVVSITGYYGGHLSYANSLEYADGGEDQYVNLHIQLNAPSTVPITVDYEIVGGTGSSSDYSAAPGIWPRGSVTIPIGDTSATISMRTVRDRIFERTESFQVRISSNDSVVIGQETATMLVADITGPPKISVADTTAVEGGSASFTVSFAGTSSDFVTTVYYTTVDSTAIAGTHYTSKSGTLTFAAGDTEKTIEVSTIGDDVLLGDKVFYLELSNPVSASIERGSATGRIIEDDCVDLADAGQSPPTLRLASASAEEGENLSFAVSLSKPFCDDVAQAVSLTTALGTATAADAATPAAVLGFKAGATEAAYTGLSTIEDAIDEDDETVTATIAWHSTMPADYRAQPAATATGTIEDDDPQPSLRIIDATAQEGDNLVFIATLDNPSGRTVTVDYTTNTAGTATTADYTPINGPDSQLVFNPGETAKQITVATAQDTLDEDDETIRVVLSDPQNAALDDTTAIGTIEDDDPQPTATIADTASAENRPLRFTITLDNPSGRTVTIAYTTADGTATTADNDYTAATGTATITPGNTTTTIEITTTADNTPEPDETLTITLTTATTDNQHQTTNTHISTTNATATGTIQNDD